MHLLQTSRRNPSWSVPRVSLCDTCIYIYVTGYLFQQEMKREWCACVYACVHTRVNPVYVRIYIHVMDVPPGLTC